MNREIDEMEADYEAYVAELEQEAWERQIEDEAYNQVIIPQYVKDLDEEAKTL